MSDAVQKILTAEKETTTGKVNLVFTLFVSLAGIEEGTIFTVNGVLIIIILVLSAMYADDIQKRKRRRRSTR